MSTIDPDALRAEARAVLDRLNMRPIVDYVVGEQLRSRPRPAELAEVEAVAAKERLRIAADRPAKAH